MGDMKAGPELDALVAKVMGLKPEPWDEETPCAYCGSVMRYCGSRSRCSECAEWRYSAYKEYSTDIRAAMELIPVVLRDWNVAAESGFVYEAEIGMRYSPDYGWRVGLGAEHDYEGAGGILWRYDAAAPELAHAICLVALCAS